MAKWSVPGLIDSRVCLLPMITDDTKYYFKLYRHYKNGLLIVNGALVDQPNKYLEIMELLDSSLIEVNPNGRNTTDI